MSGTLFGLGLSQQHGSDGKPLAGCKLYIYDGGTTTPADAYLDTGLTLLHTWPIVADTNGRIPSFWLADGTYRARLVTSAGIPQFDQDSILAIGPSSGEGSGSTVDATAIAQIGDTIWKPISGTRTGWVRCNGRTIGSSTSGASERANADTEALFLYLWTTYDNTLCPVSTGRGLTAAADWAANKTIGIPDMRGRSPFGLAGMGNTEASVFTGVPFSYGGVNFAGSLLGASTHTLTTAQLATHSHGLNGIYAPNHGHPFVFSSTQSDTLTFSGGLPFNYEGVVSAPAYTGTANQTAGQQIGGSGNLTIAGTLANTGDADAHNNTPLGMAGTWFMKS